MALTAAAVAAELERVKALHAKDQDPEALAACAALAGVAPAATSPTRARFDVLWQLADLYSHEDHHEQAIAAYAACEPLLARAREDARARRSRATTAATTSRCSAAATRRWRCCGSRASCSRVAGQPMLLRAYAALAYWHLEWGQADEAESAARVAVQQARAWNDPAELGAACSSSRACSPRPTAPTARCSTTRRRSRCSTARAPPRPPRPAPSSRRSRPSRRPRGDGRAASRPADGP